MHTTPNSAIAPAFRLRPTHLPIFVRACIGVAALTVVIALIPPVTAARQDTMGRQEPPSLGEIARRLRAEKRANRDSAKVWTNENIPPDPFAISVVGPPPPPPEPVPTATASPAAEKPKSKLEAELAEAIQQEATLEKEVDLAKRDFALQQQAVYTNPFSSQDSEGKAKLADAQTQIDSKQADLEKARARVLELQQKLDEEKKSSPATRSDTNNPGN